MSLNELDLDLSEDVLQGNPEAMLDVLTMRSLRSRFVDHDATSVASEPLVALDRDLESFVRDFQIDDSISDIFALSDDAGQQDEATSRSKHSKKTSRRSQSMDNILEAGDSTTSKKPKTFANLFTRKLKPKQDVRKEKAMTWHAEIGDVEHKVIDPRKVNSMLLNTDDANGGYMQMNNLATRRSKTLPPGLKMADHKLKMKSSESQDEYSVSHSSEAYMFDKLLEYLDLGMTDDLIREMSSLPPEVALSLCDVRGNTILHMCVMKNKSYIIPIIVSLHPGLSTSVNKEELTPVELAIKFNRLECLKIFLQKVFSKPTDSNIRTVSSFLALTLQLDQDKQVQVIIEHLAALTSGSAAVPADCGKHGHPGHVAAAHDKLLIVQGLVEMGLDVTSAGTQPELPVCAAYRNGAHKSFRFLLLLHCLETAMMEAIRTARDVHTYQANQQEKHHLMTTLLEQAGVLLAAHRQCQRLWEDQGRTIRQCQDILEDILEEQDSLQAQERIKQVQSILQKVDIGRQEYPNMQRSGDNIAQLISALQRQKPRHRATNDVKAVCRTMLKNLHTELLSANADILGEIKSCVSSTIWGYLPEKTRQQTSSSGQVSDHPLSRDGLETSDDARKGKEKPINSFANVSGSGACVKDVKTSNNPFSQAKSSKLSIDEEENEYESLLSPQELRKLTYDDNPLRLKTSANTTSQDIKSNPHIETISALTANDNQSESRDLQNSLSAQKSPVYASISFDDDEDEDGDILKMKSQFSDEESMCTISSHNSSLQAAVGRLSPGYLSDSQESYLSDISGTAGASRSRNNSSISQFDVSDFSADNSSDWLSSTNCTSCLNAESHVTSCDDDDYEVPYNYVNLNLENENLPDEQLRNHRLSRHLEAVQKLNTENSDVIETVVTASGERITSEQKEERTRFVNVDDGSRDTEQGPRVEVTLRDRKKNKVKLFHHGELVSRREISTSDFRECYDRSADVIQAQRRYSDLDTAWSDLQFSDVEEDEVKQDNAWYDVSEDEESLARAYSSDSDTSTLCGSP